MSPKPTTAANLTAGDVYVFSTGATATIKFAHHTSAGIRVVFTDPAIRAGACAPGSLHTVLR